MSEEFPAEAVSPRCPDPPHSDGAQVRPGPHAPIDTWKFRGSPHYIDQQGDRLGVSKILTDRARHNPEIYRVSILTGQLCERYHRAPKDDNRAVVSPAELTQIRNTLGQCEQELEKLHVLAAAAQTIVDEAHRAFGLDPPGRRFRIRCDFDDIAE